MMMMMMMMMMMGLITLCATYHGSCRHCHWQNLSVDYLVAPINNAACAACRNVPDIDCSSGWSPLGVAYKQDVAVHPNWTNSASGMQGKPAADAAIIITKQPIGRQLGWLNHRLPPAATVAAAVNTRRQQFDRLAGNTQQQQELLQQADAVKLKKEAPSAALVEQLVTAAGLPLHVVGYMDNKSNGSMWQQCCSKLD
jgi:hypothetical protein